MLPSEVLALTVLTTEQISVKDLARAINSSYSRTAEIVKVLVEKGFVRRIGNHVHLADTTHAMLFKKLSRKYDMLKLLSGSREVVALALLNTDEIKRLQEQTGLTYWTIKRALNKMMETGAIREREGRYYLADDENLRIFLQSWREEKERSLVESYAEIVYSSQDIIIKRVPKGKPAKGSLTAFSMFAVYGIQIQPVYDYYVQPERKLTLEDIFVHAIVFSESPVELTDCALLLAKNLSTFDLRKAREMAKKLYIEDKLLDLENYLRNMAVSIPDRLLPWNEFAEKARIYEINPESLLVSEISFDFTLLEKHIDRPVSLYVFGGEGMRIRKLKRSTKDIDIVLEDKASITLVEGGLRKIGYKPLSGDEITIVDRKLEPSGIFIKEGYPRMDLFVKRICNAFLLSNSMKIRAESKVIGKLRLYIMSNEDIFLLKSITDREGDIYDMIALAKASGFDWKTVINELYYQEEIIGRHFCRHFLDSIELIEERSGIRAPFYNDLVNHCIDQAILESIERWNATSLKEIKKLVNYPDYRLRSRILKLVKKKRLIALGNGTYRTTKYRKRNNK